MNGDSEGKESESSPPKRACRRMAIKPNSEEAIQLAEFSMNIVLSQTSIDACDESKATNSDSDTDSDSDSEDENDAAESKNDQPKYSDDYKSDSKISNDNNTNSKDVDTKDDDSK